MGYIEREKPDHCVKLRALRSKDAKVRACDCSTEQTRFRGSRLTAPKGSHNMKKRQRRTQFKRKRLTFLN